MSAIHSPPGQAPIPEQESPMTSPVNVGALEVKVDNLIQQSKDTHVALQKLTDAVSRLAVIEERQANDRQATERAFNEIALLKRRQDDREEAMDRRFKPLEERGPITQMVNGGVVRIVWLVLAAVAGAGLSGLLRPIPQSSVEISVPAQK